MMQNLGFLFALIWLIGRQILLLVDVKLPDVPVKYVLRRMSLQLVNIEMNMHASKLLSVSVRKTVSVAGLQPKNSLLVLEQYSKVKLNNMFSTIKNPHHEGFDFA